MKMSNSPYYVLGQKAFVLGLAAYGTFRLFPDLYHLLSPMKKNEETDEEMEALQLKSQDNPNQIWINGKRYLANKVQILESGALYIDETYIEKIPSSYQSTHHNIYHVQVFGDLQGLTTQGPVTILGDCHGQINSQGRVTVHGMAKNRINTPAEVKLPKI